MQSLTKAYNFAAQKHINQRRKNAEASPYINHPIEVALLLAQGEIENIEVIIAGILHDTVEDTDTTYEELVKEFGESIADFVMQCTDDKSLPKVERKKHQITHAGKISYGGKLVKLADKLSNLSSLEQNPPESWSKEVVYGYFVWAFAVCRGMKGTNTFLESKLQDIFDRIGVSKLGEEELQSDLQAYYQNIN